MPGAEAHDDLARVAVAVAVFLGPVGAHVTPTDPGRPAVRRLEIVEVSADHPVIRSPVHPGVPPLATYASVHAAIIGPKAAGLYASSS